MTDTQQKSRSQKDAFASVAFWQFMAFIVLLCFVWANEFLDLPHVLFGEEPASFSLFRAFTLSAAVIVCGVIAVGHTYQQQRAIVGKLLTTCLYCHRVQTGPSDDSWEHVEQYFMKQYPMDLEERACPECQTMIAYLPDDQSEKLF